MINLKKSILSLAAIATLGAFSTTAQAGSNYVPMDWGSSAAIYDYGSADISGVPDVYRTPMYSTTSSSSTGSSTTSLSDAWSGIGSSSSSESLGSAAIDYLGGAIGSGSVSTSGAGASSMSSYIGTALDGAGIKVSSDDWKGVLGGATPKESALSFGTQVNRVASGDAKTGAPSMSYISTITAMTQIDSLDSLGDFYKDFSKSDVAKELGLDKALEDASKDLGETFATASSDFGDFMSETFSSDGEGMFSGWGDTVGGWGDSLGETFSGWGDSLGEIDFGGFDLDFSLGGLTDGINMESLGLDGFMDSIGIGDLMDMDGLMGNLQGTITENLTGLLADNLGSMLSSFDFGSMFGSITSFFG